MLLSEAIALHRIHLCSRRRSPKTISWYDEQLTAFQKWRGRDDRLPSVDEIEQFLAACHERLSPATVHARYRALKALFRFLEKRKRIERDENPMYLLEAPSIPKTIRPYVSLDELRSLLATCEEDWIGLRDRLIFLLLFFSGLRLGEIATLRVDDLNVAKLEVLVRRGKGDKARVVPMSPEVRPVLAAYLFQRPQHLEMLWLASDGKGRAAGVLSAEGIRQMIFRRCRKAGLPRLNPHRFRHGFAMWLLNNGARITTVATAMGHSDPAITSAVYAHTVASTVRREYDQALANLIR